MATKIIPLDSTFDNFSITVELDSMVYGMDFKFDLRNERWYVDLFDSNNNLLLAGLPAMVSWPLLKQFEYRTDIPKGVLYFLDQNGTEIEPGRFDLGARVLMIYQEAAS